MDTNRIREIHKGTAYPESRSVYQALLQVWNECEQEKQMNKGKIIDADELKSRLSTTTSYDLAYTNWVLKLIDELSEDREDVVRIKGSEFCNEEPNEYMKFTDWAVREGYTTKVPNSIMNLFIHYLESINKHKKEQPNPLKVAIKGDGTEEYSKVIFQYFSSHTIKGLHDVDSFEQEAYYFIENNELVFSLNLPEGYTEISLKEKKPTGLMLDLKRRVEAIEKQSNRWYDKFQKQKINYREAIERVEELEIDNATLCKALTELSLKLNLENYQQGKNTILAVGKFDDANGVFVEWLGVSRVVVRIDGKDYKQTFEEFVNNCK